VKTILKISIILVLCFQVSCDQPRPNFNIVIIPDATTNFKAVNSSWDDYNSMPITIEFESQFSLVFSTNRHSYGDNFDFEFYECIPRFNIIDGEFQIETFWSQYDTDEDSLFEIINSPNNELGPYLTNDLFYWYGNNSDESENRLFYTSDINGDLDIFCIYYSNEYHKYIPTGSSFNVTGINTDSDEGYLTIHKAENPGMETVYFTSNRDGNFDIYCAISEQGKLIDQSQVPEVFKVESLSSDAEDKCPFVAGDLMVFASDRAGGSGGYDLWYSIYKDNEWSAPENFGEDINTEYDEFRPSILVTNPDEFINNLMIFSSNRPGGQGGFDLYYIGVSKSL
jgi:WD40-like Beta Propeller Repeat